MDPERVQVNTGIQKEAFQSIAPFVNNFTHCSSKKLVDVLIPVARITLCGPYFQFSLLSDDDYARIMYFAK